MVNNQKHTPREISSDVNAVFYCRSHEGIACSAEILDAVEVLHGLFDRHVVLVLHGETVLCDAKGTQR